MIKYNIEGNKKGELLVFITGAGVGQWMWEKQKVAFKEYKCLFFDLPGHGENSHEEFKSIGDLAMRVNRIIQKESSKGKATVIGFSIGAQTVMKMIESYPKCLNKAVITSGLNKKVKNMTRSTVNVTSAMSTPLAKFKLFAKLQGREIDIPRDMFKRYYECSKNVSKETLANIMFDNTNYLFENKKGHDVKTLILAGKKEASMMKESAEKTHGLIKSSEVKIIDGVGHSLPYNKSEVFNEVVLEFLKR